ncbi:MAG: hypothetical protein LBR54_01425 [Oscillospiraceae bacterium]|nr:hypothetical protein [Oscillospiraceae bacterium]
MKGAKGAENNCCMDVRKKRAASVTDLLLDSLFDIFGIILEFIFGF